MSLSRMRSWLPANRWVRGGLVALVTVVALAAMVLAAATKLDVGAATSALSHASLIWVLIAAAAVAAAFCARSESWFALLRAGLGPDQVQRGLVARGLMIGVAASTVAPARAGEAVRSVLIARRTGCATLPTVIGTVVAQTVLNIASLAMLGVVVIASGETRSLHIGGLAVAVAGPILGVLAVVGIVRGARRIGCARAARRDGKPARGRGWLGRQVDGAGRGVCVLSRPRVLAHGGGCQIAAWALQCLACWAVLMALGLGHEVSPAAAAAVLLAINLAAVVPLTPGNVGLFQAACIAVLTPLGVGAGHALAYGLLLQGVEIAVALALGIPAALREGLSLLELGRLSIGGRRLALAAN